MVSHAILDIPGKRSLHSGDQKVGKTVILQDLQETVQKAHEDLSNTWTKP